VAAEQTFVIVGAGLAGARAAAALRTQGFDGRVVLLGVEEERPYNRPPLSKDYLQGKSEKEKVYLHPQGWYAEHDIELRLGTRVTDLDLAGHQVVLAGGERLGNDKLLLATGSSPRRLSVPGSELSGVLYLRTLADCEAMKAAFATAKRVAIIGAGWIGLETAAAARATGCEVTVIERGELPLLRVLGRELAAIYAALHRDHGVDLRMDATVAEITGQDGRVSGIRLAEDSVVAADAVVVGVGITPDTGLAEAAGLTVDNGVVVDEYLVTSDPDVFAAVDVANSCYAQYGIHLRLEHWSAALDRGRSRSPTWSEGTRRTTACPTSTPPSTTWGWSTPATFGTDGYDEVVFRGDVATGSFVAFWLKDSRVLAGMNVNVWDVTDAIQALVRLDHPVDPAKLADPGVPLSCASTRSAAAPRPAPATPPRRCRPRT